MLMMMRIMSVFFVITILFPNLVIAQTANAKTTYISPMRQQCMDEMKKDKLWLANIKARVQSDLSYEWQNNNVIEAAKNNRHVIGSYGVIWVLVVIFVLFLFRRHIRMMSELKKLKIQFDTIEKKLADTT